MDRPSAERVFALVNEISGDLRGRIVTERWWLVWIAVGLDMLLSSALIQYLLRQDPPGVAGPLAVMLGNAAVLALLIRFIHRRAGGLRTATEGYVWWIWAADILASYGVMAQAALAGRPPFETAPVYALISAFAFAMMAMVADRFFLVYAAFFVGVMAVMTALPGWQFLVYGGAWCFTLTALGLYYRLAHNPDAARPL